MNEPKGSHFGYCISLYANRRYGWNCVCRILHGYLNWQREHPAEFCREDCFDKKGVVVKARVIEKAEKSKKRVHEKPNPDGNRKTRRGKK